MLRKSSKIKRKSNRSSAKKSKEKIDLSNVKRMGKGEQRLYAYSFPVHMGSDQTYYPIKVDMTSRNSATERILEQLNASNSEPAHLLIEISCSNAKQLESKIHARLKNRRILDAPGKEWFTTNVDEILREIYAIDPAIKLSFGRESKAYLPVLYTEYMLRELMRFFKGLASILLWLAEVSTRQIRRRTKRRLKRRYRVIKTVLVKSVCALAFSICVYALLIN